MLLASVTGSITSAIGNAGLYAIFGLMVLSAVLPAASELTMLYGGAVASGAIVGAHLSLFGTAITTPAWGFVAVALTGVLGTAVGCVGGWAIGTLGERQFVERHGRWLHVSPAKIDRAQRGFDRYGALFVPVGLALPLLRSFVAIPAGLARMALARFLPLAMLGSAVFCFALAGAGWALGASYDSVRADLRYFEYAVLAVALVVAAVLVWRFLASRTARRAAELD